MKDVLLLFLSEFHLTNAQTMIVTQYDSEFGRLDCVQTNEAAVKYGLASLERRGRTLDRIFLFATNKTRESLKLFVNGKLQEKSHLECFEERLCSERPKLRGRFEIIDYDEDVEPEKSIAQVVQMAQKIRQYSDRVGEQVVLHADMTGGFRHASMLMLAVMRLLKYSGMTIGRVFYANFPKRRLEDVTDIHRIFDLVSGAEEFVSFGSVEMLLAYFAERKELVKRRQLEELLATIKDFSDAVRICRTGKFEELLGQLGQKIEAFEELADKSLQENLFAEIIETVRREYADILAEDAGRIEIIAWCVRKGFLQQAMTLYTEWVPAYVVEKKVYYPNPLHQVEIQEKCEQMNGGYKKWENVFLHEYYCDKSANLDTTGLSAKLWSPFRAMLQRAIKERKRVELAAPFDTEKIKNVLLEIHKVDQEVYLRHIPEREMARSYPGVYQILQLNYKSNPEYAKAGFSHFISIHCTEEHLLKFLCNAPERALEQIFAMKFCSEAERERIQTLKNSPLNVDIKWRKRRKQLAFMLENGWVKSGVDGRTMEEILYAAHWIHSQRNQINHAYGGAEVAKSSDFSRNLCSF